MPKLLDLFCGIGGWSKGFARFGWTCTGVDIKPFNYPGELVICSVLELKPNFINSFDAITASPPCEDFARAYLPWLRGDFKPQQWAIDLLEFSIRLCDRPNRIVECSRFSSNHAPPCIFCNNYALWGDVPPLLPFIAQNKMKKSGLRPELRAEIPLELSFTVAKYFTNQIGKVDK